MSNPSNTNPYAPPQQQLDPPGQNLPPPDDMLAYWDGDALAVPKGMALAGYCVKCNKPTRHLSRRGFSWMPGQNWIWLVLSWAVFMVLSERQSKHGALYIAMCPVHRWRYRLGTLLMLLSPVSWVAMFGLAAACRRDEGLFILLIFGSFPVAAAVLVTGYWLRRVIWASKIDDKRIWLSGMSPDWGTQAPTGP